MSDDKPSTQYQYKYASEDDAALVAANKEIKDKDKELEKKGKAIDELNVDVKMLFIGIAALIILNFAPSPFVAWVFVIGGLFVAPIGLAISRYRKFKKKNTAGKLEPTFFDRMLFWTAVIAVISVLFMAFSVKSAKRPTTNDDVLGSIHSIVLWATDVIDSGRGTRKTCPACEPSKPCKPCEPTRPCITDCSKCPCPPTAERCLQPPNTSCALSVTTDCPGCTITELPPRPPLKPQPQSACDPTKDKANCPIPQLTTDKPLSKEVPTSIQYDLDKLPDHSRFIAPCNGGGDC